MPRSLSVESWVRQRLDDRANEDYFQPPDDLSGICWKHVVDCRCTQVVVTLKAIEARMTPLVTPGVYTAGTLWIMCSSYGCSSLYSCFLSCGALDPLKDQPQHKYGLYQANAYIDEDFAEPQPEIDEIGITAEFSAIVSGDVTLIGYPINLNRLMFDIFTAIADSLGKLAISQSTAGGTTDLRTAAEEAKRRAGAWLNGTIIHAVPLRGSRR